MDALPISSSSKLCTVMSIMLAIFVYRIRAGMLFDIESFGAVGDGRTDNTKAFKEAFKKACGYDGMSRVLVPEGTYLVGSNRYKGPCRGPIDINVVGTLRAPAGPTGLDHWFTFQNIDQLSITGKGTFDGQGKTAWNHNDCNKNSDCQSFPVTIRFDFVTNSVIREITSLNSKNFHINIFGSSDIKIERIRLIAPAESPNTDGVHIADSRNIKVLHSTIATGDDCVSLGPGSKNIEILYVKCGPGHGISIGSLGKTHPYDVSGIVVKNSELDGTENGLRIKTWAPSLKSKVYDLTFENIEMKNVKNPIFIDQQYCPGANCDMSLHLFKSKTYGSGKIRGTSSSRTAVNLKCSRLFPCKDINLADINLSYKGPEGAVNASCLHVEGSAEGLLKPNLRSCV